MSASSPYIYNPKECVILGYKKYHIKQNKGESQWKGELIEVENEDGSKRTKLSYQDKDKEEFKELVFGQWSYFADTKSLTKATFSMDIPTKAIKILSYVNDLVLDPFAGSGTTLCAAEIENRRWIGIELSGNYSKVAQERVQHFTDRKKQLELNL
jgi:site-specific DNA-methyltransferase (adenine-specific)